ncbi:10020_t:CDS:1, partial [Cetraspora pellucida]
MSSEVSAVEKLVEGLIKLVEELIKKKIINSIYYNEFGNFETISDVGYFYISKAEWKNFKINVAVKAVKSLFNQYSYKILVQE